MKTVAGLVLMVIWFYHLATGAVAAAAIYRIWPERQLKFVRYTLLHLLAPIVDSLGAVVCLLLAQDVRFTWKFAISLFAFMLLRDVVRLPLMLYLLRGPSKR